MVCSLVVMLASQVVLPSDLLYNSNVGYAVSRETVLIRWIPNARTLQGLKASAASIDATTSRDYRHIVNIYMICLCLALFVPGVISSCGTKDSKKRVQHCFACAFFQIYFPRLVSFLRQVGNDLVKYISL